MSVGWCNNNNNNNNNNNKIVNEHVYGAKGDVYFETCYSFAKGAIKITVKHSENKGKTVFRTMTTLKKICL
jgi:hypothetical protein